MTSEMVKASTEFLVQNKIPFDIVMDNVFTYSVGKQGSTVVFDYNNRVGISIRTNIEEDQAQNPIEMRIFDFDHIEAIKVRTDDQNKVVNILKSLGKTSPKLEKVIREFLDQQCFHNMSITGSTGDGVGNNWSGKVVTRPGLVSDYAVSNNDETEDKE